MLNAKAFGLACGVLWGAGVLVLGLIAMKTGYADEIVTLLGTGYRGYAMSVQGSVIGAAWGFCDGFIGGWLLAWLYNKFAS